MPIIHTPTVPGGYFNRIDEQNNRGRVFTREESQDLSADPLALDIFNLREKWTVTSVEFSASGATASA